MNLKITVATSLPAMQYTGSAVSCVDFEHERLPLGWSSGGRDMGKDPPWGRRADPPSLPVSPLVTAVTDELLQT